MTTDVDSEVTRDVRTLPFRKTVPRLVREPLKTVETIGSETSGEIVRLNLGMFRPYLVTHPDHVQHVLRDNAANYRREGMMWKPLSRLVGEPSGADPAWPVKRAVFQSLLTGKNIASFTDRMAATIVEAVEELGLRVEAGQPVDASKELNRIVYRAILRIFFGDKLSLADLDELGDAITLATTSSFRARMLMPFVPHFVPLPGDRAFHRAIRVVDELMYPIVRAARRRGPDGDDVLSRLLQASLDNGDRLNDQQVRDGAVSLFVAGTETTVTALTWLWVVLDDHPDVAAKLHAELDQVVGAEQPVRAHLADLRYTKMVLNELLRIYSVGWIIPRIAAADDVVDGVRIRGGATVIITPYLTHRLADIWPDPYCFDPERFAPGKPQHRFSYIAFGAGPHQCVGSLFFTVEAQLIVAAMIGRLRPALHRVAPVEPYPGLTLKPRERVEITLRPAERR